MGGFFAGIGVILVDGGLTVAMGEGPRLDTLDDAHMIQLGGSAMLFAVLLYVAITRFDRRFALPAALFAAFIVFYAVFLATGQNFDDAARTGWLLQIDSGQDRLFPVMSVADWASIDWIIIFSQSGAMLVVALLGAIMLLLDTTAIEIIARKELSPNKELTAMGGANLVAGALGGYPGVHVASDTALAYKLGSDSRLMGFVYVGMVTLALLAGAEFVGVVPTFILGALLIYLGLDFLIDWVWKARKLLPLPDYLTVLAILAAIVTFGILKGVVFGFVLAVGLFVADYSRLNVIRSAVSGEEHASNIDRDLETRELLNREGQRILIVTLQGFIFFGTAEKLLSEIRVRLGEREETDIEFLILKFRHVSQLDTSAIKAFSKLSQSSDRRGFHIIITDAEPEWIERLNTIKFLQDSKRWKRLSFNHLDDSLTWCEGVILSEMGLDTRHNRRTLANLLSVIIEDESQCRAVETYFTKRRLKQGEYLFSEGDVGDSLYILSEGSLVIVIQSVTGQGLLRRFQPGAIVGEMALYTDEPRSASVFVEEDAVLYRLDTNQLESMQKNHPMAANRLHSYIVRLLTEWVRRLNRELQYL